MIRRPPRSTLSSSSAASDVYKRQVHLSTRDVRLRRSRSGLRPELGRGVLVLEKVPHLHDLAIAHVGDEDYSQVKPPPVSLRAVGVSVSYTHLRAHETPEHLVCRLLLEKKKKKKTQQIITIVYKKKKKKKKHKKQKNK